MLKKPVSHEELLSLHEWCQTLLSLILQEGSAQQSSAAAEEAPRSGIDAAFQNGDRRGLKAVARDLHEWASGLSLAQRARMDQQLRVKFGRGLTEETEDVAAEVKAVLERGQISDEDEYRLLEARVDEILADPKRADELSAINQLLGTYVKP